jgi:regulation of enolase protein 1 (concanavalin A-like superfamily)
VHWTESGVSEESGMTEESMMTEESTDVTRRTIDWADGRWTTAPVASVESADGLVATAAEGSDAWRVTSYGFVHDTEHALVAPLAQERAVEVAFSADFAGQFDQAGVFVRAAEDTWIKAGVEFADGVLGVGAVVTNGVSDWSIAPVPEWSGHRIVVRVSREGDAVTVRARRHDERFRLVRVAPFPADAIVEAGPFLCAPTRAGLDVTFHAWTETAADPSLH